MIEYKGKYTKGRILIDKLEQYQKVMKGIYTTSVSKKQLVKVLWLTRDLSLY